MSRIAYFKRILSAYILGGNSHLTFWHGTPQLNANAFTFPGKEVGQYYMKFLEKADYPGPFDEQGIPMLDYRGNVGKQYNPIAIAQYGLGNYNLFCQKKDEHYLDEFLKISYWLADNLRENTFGILVWMHDFDWEYREILKAPWYSALAQGQGISVLVRAYKETKNEKYLDAAKRAFLSFEKNMDEGGVNFIDDKGNIWFEEVIVSPPTHILNGFIWALWGVYDYYLVTGDEIAEKLFSRGVKTLETDIDEFDMGFWSLYELSGTKLKMVASRFYHNLHIVQLEVMYRLTGKDVFRKYADKWENYQKDWWKRNAALGYKAVFKLLYY